MTEDVSRLIQDCADLSVLARAQRGCSEVCGCSDCDLHRDILRLERVAERPI